MRIILRNKMEQNMNWMFETQIHFAKWKMPGSKIYMWIIPFIKHFTKQNCCDRKQINSCHSLGGEVATKRSKGIIFFCDNRTDFCLDCSHNTRWILSKLIKSYKNFGFTFFKLYFNQKIKSQIHIQKKTIGWTWKFVHKKITFWIFQNILL